MAIVSMEEELYERLATLAEQLEVNIETMINILVTAHEQELDDDE